MKILIRSKIIGNGQPLVLLHAFPLSHVIWENIGPPAGFQLILPDFPGFGLSSLAPGVTLETAAEALRDHLEELGVKQAVLGGISMGGYWALEFMRLIPKEIKALVLISTRAGLDNPEGRRKRLEIAEQVEKEGTDKLAESMIPGLLGASTRARKPELAALVAHWIRLADPQAVAGAQRAMANRRDQTEFLSKWPIPALVLAGREDLLIPFSESESMARTLPRAQCSVLDSVGHLIPLESPGPFQEAVGNFLSSFEA